MFVKDNTISAAKAYFFEQLNGFSATELKFMWSEILRKRFNWTKADLLINSDFRFSESDLLFIRSFVKRLIKDEPFQYILGETEFYGLIINCDKRALIPRPETEELVDWISEHSSVAKAIDICSGSGCIALALKKIFNDARIIGIDISEDANDLARLNARRNSLQVTFETGDALDTNSPYWDSFFDLDLIVSNPPYIPTEEKIEMSKNVLDFEPHLALFVDKHSPIIFYERIADLAQKKLKPGGWIYFELHHKFSDDVKNYLEKLGFKEIEIKKDLQGKNRMIRAIK